MTKRNEGPLRRAVAALPILGLLVAATPAAALGIRDIAGSYAGSWTNLTFGSTGPAQIDISFDGASAEIRFDMGGPVFGGFDPPPVTMLGTVVGDSLVINAFGVSIFGDISGSVDGSDGSFSFLITNIPGGFISEVTAEGAIANGTLDLDYTILFDGPTGPTNPALGVLTAVVPEPAPTALLLLGTVGMAASRRRGARCCGEWEPR